MKYIDRAKQILPIQSIDQVLRPRICPSDLNLEEGRQYLDNDCKKCWNREMPKCRVCGCTWDKPCEGGCYWVEDDLCSKCAEKEGKKHE